MRCRWQDEQRVQEWRDRQSLAISSSSSGSLFSFVLPLQTHSFLDKRKGNDVSVPKHKRKPEGKRLKERERDTRNTNPREKRSNSVQHTKRGMKEETLTGNMSSDMEGEVRVKYRHSRGRAIQKATLSLLCHHNLQ